MAKRDDVPQTAADAQALGWGWLKVTCLACKHTGTIPLTEIGRRAPAGRLSAFAAKLYCGKCRARRLKFELAMYVVEGGQPWSHYRQIVFREGVAGRPSRE